MVSKEMLRVLALITAHSKSDKEAWRVLMPDDAGPEAREVITGAVSFATVQAALVAELSERDQHEYVTSLRGWAVARQAALEHLDMLAAHEAVRTCYQCGESTEGCRSGWICDDCGTGDPSR